MTAQTTNRPVLAVSAYTLGALQAGVLSGVVVAFGLQEIMVWIVENIDGINRPGTVFLAVHGVIGLALVVTGGMLLRLRPPRTRELDPASEGHGVTFVLAGAFGARSIWLFLKQAADASCSR